MDFAIAAISCGITIGFTLGMIGGGGSIVAIPSLLYLLDLPRGMAVGTASATVAASSVFNLLMHLRSGQVRWRPAGIFASSGMIATLVGAHLGKRLPTGWFLLLFALILLAAAVRIAGLRRLPTRQRAGSEGDRMTWRTGLLLAASALFVGAISGLLGIGGGFLIVPSLVLLADLPIASAIGSSLVVVLAFSATTAASYASSGLIDWSVVAILAVGCVAGGTLGIAASRRIAGNEISAKRIFGAIYATTALCMGYQGLGLSLHVR